MTSMGLPLFWLYFEYTILPFLKYQGVREVDYLFLTHSDADHINGVEELLRQSGLGIRIKRLVVTDAEMLDEYGNIVAVATEQGVPIYEMNQGTLVVSGDLKIEWNKENNHVYMTGPAKTICKGEIEYDNNQ